MIQYMSKPEARNAVLARGFTVHYYTGRCGDYGHGSRLYFKRPEAELNQYGQPLEHATISRAGTKWYPSFFEKKANAE